MSRALSLGWLKLAPLTIVVILAQSAAQSALAQPEEGRRGRGEGRGGRMGFGAPMLRLASNEEVQGVLKLSDEQKEKVEDLDDEMRDEFRSLFESGGDRDEMRKLSEEGAQKLNEILDDAQEKRITEIAIQAYGVNAIMMSPSLGKELNVTDDQRTQLGDVQRENFQSMGEAFRDMRDQDLSQEERRAKFDELRTEADKKLLAVLTSEQQKQLDSLKGEKVDIDLQQLRGFGGGGRGGRDGRDGDRGGRDRDRDGERGERNRDRDRDSEDTDDSSAGN
jgi:Spy/CpxP family protein refolding chaperone